MDFALLQKGFRPFFLAAAAFAAIWVPVWSIRFSTGWSASWTGTNWHAHEMLFGFFAAVIAGFLLTAVENWTKDKTVNSRQLLMLVALWGTGRVAMVTGDWYWLGSLLDVLFLPMVTFFVTRPIWRSRNRRNYGIPVILTALAGLNLTSHLAVYNANPELGRTALLMGVYLVSALVLMIGGRVIPFFTSSRINKPTSSNPKFEKALIAGAAGLVILPVFGFSKLTGAWMIVLGIGALVRMKNWQVIAALRVPMLAILHLGHIWLALGLIARGSSELLPFVSPNQGLHLITVGGLSTISFGMMARVGVGHTGRPIEAAPSIILAFVLINIAVVFRGVLPIFLPQFYVGTVTWASTFWAAAFAIYLIKYLPILTLVRPDGKPG